MGIYYKIIFIIIFFFIFYEILKNKIIYNMSSSNNPKISNAPKNVGSYSNRDYKNLLRSAYNNINSEKKINGKFDSLNSNFSINRNNFQNNLNQAKNLTRDIFSSQSKRFQWQTNESINRHSSLNGSTISLRQKDLKSDNWNGLTTIVQKEDKNYNNYKK